MDFTRLFDILYYQNAKFPQQDALVYKKQNTWKSFSTQECLDQINQVSAGLLNLGVKKGDKLAIISYIGSPQWNFLDMGIQQIGAIVVPVHATVNPFELTYILNNATVKYCIVSKEALFKKVQAVIPEVPSLKKIFSIEKIDQVDHWSNLQAKTTSDHLAKIEAIKSAIQAEDLASIIYTSGTTGNPKGVMLSHKNIVSNIKSIIPLIPIDHEKKALSFLPMSHIFERMITYTYMATGASVHYAEKTDKIVENLNEVHPHYFATVPKLLEQMYDSILNTLEKKGALQKRILQWSINLAMNYQEYKKRSILSWIQHHVADFLVYRKWRNLLGGNVEGIIVGAAALRPELGRLFSAAGIHTREGYGLTETSPVLAVNRFEPGGFRFGTVGIAIPGVEIKIENQNEDGEGEIVVRGPNIMMGYYKLPDETTKVLNKEAWFNTGDIGKIVHKRFLQITDRKKDIFKTTSGKYIAPQVLENKLKTSHYILQAMIIGFNRPYVTALIVPNFTALKIWCNTNGVHWTAPQFMAINPKVVQLMTSIIDEFNNKLTTHKKVINFHLLHEEWSPETQEFTPTLKIKRNYILQKFEKEINALYQ